MTESNSVSGYISYRAEYNVLICRACKRCISPINDGIRRHFMRKHKRVPLKTRNEIIEYSESLRLVNPDEVAVPQAEIEVVEDLEVFTGWICQESDDCRECCTTEGSMEKHCRAAHNWTVFKGQSWKKQSFQTFFRGPYVSYFPITSRFTCRVRRHHVIDIRS